MNPKKEARKRFKNSTILARGVQRSLNFCKREIKNSPMLNLTSPLPQISKEEKSLNPKRDSPFEFWICLLECQKRTTGEVQKCFSFSERGSEIFQFLQEGDKKFANLKSVSLNPKRGKITKCKKRFVLQIPNLPPWIPNMKQESGSKNFQL